MIRAILLLDALALPIAALVLGIAVVHAARFYFESQAEWRRSLDRWQSDWQDQISGLNGSWLTAHWESKAADREDRKDREDHIAAASERILIAFVQATGGFPSGGPRDDVSQIVREVRKLYAELDQPTPEPATQSGDGIGADGSGADLDELNDEEFAEFFTDEEG